jgi:hypothetical protein
VWDGEPFWKKALIAVGPCISIGAIILLIALIIGYLTYDDNNPGNSWWSYDSPGRSVKKRRQQEQKGRSQKTGCCQQFPMI